MARKKAASTKAVSNAKPQPVKSYRCPSKRKVDKIALSDLASFKNWLRAQALADNTISTFLHRLRKIFVTAIRAKITGNLPWPRALKAI